MDYRRHITGQLVQFFLFRWTNKVTTEENGLRCRRGLLHVCSKYPTVSHTLRTQTNCFLTFKTAAQPLTLLFVESLREFSIWLPGIHIPRILISQQGAFVGGLVPLIELCLWVPAFILHLVPSCHIEQSRGGSGFVFLNDLLMTWKKITCDRYIFLSESEQHPQHTKEDECTQTRPLSLAQTHSRVQFHKVNDTS